ncbi:hypothetical protein Gotur_032512 [Gossypium turneri]
MVRIGCEVSEEVCHRRGQWSRQGAQEAWFEQRKIRSQEGKEEQKEASKLLLVSWSASVAKLSKASRSQRKNNV